jgi:hypothetical protein
MVQPAMPNTMPWRFLSSTARALVPNVLFDVVGTISVFLLLAPHFASSSVIPLLAASLVPIAAIALNAVQKRRVDIIGVIVLVGLAASIAAAAFGGGQRLLLLRESMSTGAIGFALCISPIFPKPIGYYIIRHFIAAHEDAHGICFDRLYESYSFRRTLRDITFFWGLLLLVEFALRAFMAFTLPVAIVVSTSPLILNTLMLFGAIVSAFWMSRGIRDAMSLML